jgi:LmbE family N-acetylglucosaminyl deacetylase
MLDLVLDSKRRRTLRLLCVGAHCDDIEIGCAATLLAIQGRANRVVIDWVVLSGSAQRQKETKFAMEMLVLAANRGKLVFGDLPDGRFPAVYDKLKDFCERLKRLPRPDLILCHERNDLHQDHRIVNEVIWNTFRDNLVLEYEVPKWDGGLGQPNVYVPVDADQARVKVNSLLRAYGSQKGKDWFTRDTFMAILRLRGVECRSPSGYAEAFHGRKLRFKLV